LRSRGRIWQRWRWRWRGVGVGVGTVCELCEPLLRGNVAGARAGCPAALDHHLPDMVLHGIDDECAPTPR